MFEELFQEIFQKELCHSRPTYKQSHDSLVVFT